MVNNEQLNSKEVLEFDEHFQSLVEKAKDRNLRLIKLEKTIPEIYEKEMEYFLKKFFENDPFEFKPDDLEEVFVNGKAIKQIKSDRRPTTYLSLFRFLELNRQKLAEIKQDISSLAEIIKEEKANYASNEQFLTAALNDALSAGRIYKNIYHLTSGLYIKLIKQINQELQEAKNTQGSDAYLNLRKANSEVSLRSMFYPYYEKLFSNSMFLLAVSQKIRGERLNLLAKLDLPTK